MNQESVKNIPNETKIQWEVNVPIFKNPFILRDLGIALGIPFGIIAIIILIATEGKVPGPDAIYALGFIGAIFLLTFIFIMLFWGGRYGGGYVVDSKGILNYTQKKQAKRNMIINSLLVIMGLFTRKPTAVGVGILAQSRQSVFVKWNNIKKVKTYPKSKTIIVRGGYAEKIAIFCTEENYSEVEALIMSKIKK